VDRDQVIKGGEKSREKVVGEVVLKNGNSRQGLREGSAIHDRAHAGRARGKKKKDEALNQCKRKKNWKASGGTDNKAKSRVLLSLAASGSNSAPGVKERSLKTQGESNMTGQRSNLTFQNSGGGKGSAKDVFKESARCETDAQRDYSTPRSDLSLVIKEKFRFHCRTKEERRKGNCRQTEGRSEPWEVTVFGKGAVKGTINSANTPAPSTTSEKAIKTRDHVWTFLVILV